ncbi:hypothetical protein WJX82_005400 [Trebouxia sp. C0006]
MRFRNAQKGTFRPVLPQHDKRTNSRPTGSSKLKLAAVVQTYLALSPVLEQTSLYSGWVGKLLALAGACLLTRALLSFKRWGDETPQAGRFFAIFAALLVELTVDNAFTWAVAASDINKYAWTPPLQDNVEIWLNSLKAAYPWTEILWQHEWINIKHKLVSLIALAFSVLFDQVPYSGFAMMTRVAACIAICRTIRTIAFMLTVLPSPRPGCYSRRFLPVPDTWGEYLSIGFGELRGRGGCNDLIISGHCIIYVMAPLVFHTYYPGWTASFLWLAVIRTCFRAPMTHQHYAVDMFLAVVVTSLVWMQLDWICPACKPLPPRHPADPPDRRGPLQWLFIALIFIVLVSLGVIVIGGGA